MTVHEFSKKIDFTILRPEATKVEMEKFCDTACKYDFYTVAVLPNMVDFVKTRLKGTDIGITVAISFPTGLNTIRQKVNECSEAIQDGADEFDMVVNVADVKLNNFYKIEEEIKQFKNVTNGLVSKLIFEAPLLSEIQIKILCMLCVEYNIDFVKTSTGFGGNIARVEDVKIMKESVHGETLVKAAGGIRDLKKALSMIDAGAERLGISSAPEIVNDYKKKIMKDKN